jgi:hypothetical protein
MGYDMGVSLRHPVTGEVKVQQEGWSWSCFLGSGIFGIPLFKRGLVVCGSAMLALDLITLIVGWVPTRAADSVYFWLSVVGFGASFFFGMKANDMATQRALDRGWVYADPHRQWFS